MQRKNISQVHPNSSQIFSQGFENKFSLPRKIKSFIWIEWEISPRNFFALPFQQFQVLFYSPFEVLFIFPSQYFFAIGLLSIFSFGWITPPKFWAAFPNNSTLRNKIFFSGFFLENHRAITFYGIAFQQTYFPKPKKFYF